MPGRRSARRAVLVALALVALAGPAWGQAPPPEGDRRVIAPDELLAPAAQERIAAAIAAVESEHPGRSYFVLVTRDAPAAAARAAVAEWTRRAAADPRVAWRPGSSFLVAASPGAEDVALEVPPSVRDALGISPFGFRDQVVGPHFAGAAKRGDFALGLEKLVGALAAWLANAEQDASRERLLALEDADHVVPQVAVDSPAALSERLRALEAKTAALETEGVELAPVESHLATARRTLRALLALPSERPELANRLGRRVREEIDSAGSLLERAESERVALLEHAKHVKDAIDQARRDLGATPELEAAQAAWLAASRERMKHPVAAAHDLEEAENALVRAHPIAMPEARPPAPALELSWRRFLAALLALVVVFGVGLVSVLRAARAEARAAYLARRDEVGRDARELREIFERLRGRRDQVARPREVGIPGALGVELGLAKPGDESATVPLAPAHRGETEKLLVGAGNGLAEVGAAWDSGERALEEAALVARRARFFEAESFVAARTLLDLVPERVELEPTVATVRMALERLGEAAADARTALANAWSLVQRARAGIDDAARGGVSPLAFEEDLGAMLERVGDAVFAAAADPLRAILLAEGASEAAHALHESAERAVALQLEIVLSGDAVARVERLLEPGTATGHDPRGDCERARGALAEAAAALELGAPDEAKRELDQARAHIALAEEMLARGEEARRSGDTTVEQRRREAAEARAELESARAALDAAERESSPALLADVRPVVEAAHGTLPLLDEALEALARDPGPAASPERHARLLRLDAHVTELERAAHIVGERLAQLRATREQLPQHADEIAKRLRELEDHARQEDVALRADTIERLAAVRAAVASVTEEARKPSVADVRAVASELDAVDGELEECRHDVVRDAFLCRRVLSARKAAEESVRAADDAIRRGVDRVAGRARSRRASDLILKVEATLTSPATDWLVVLEAYSSALRASRAARELGSGKGKERSDAEHALSAAASAIRRAERFAPLLGRAEVTEAQSLATRARSEAATNGAAAVDLAERAAAAADEALRAALLASRDHQRAGEKAFRELVRQYRKARDTFERNRRAHDAERRAQWIARRFVKATESAPSAPSAAPTATPTG